MTINNIDVEYTFERVKIQIAEEEDLSPALRSSLEVMLLLVTLLANRFGLNSQNSSKPPSIDPNRKKNQRAKATANPADKRGTTVRH